jgi:hypothetical protein
MLIRKLLILPALLAFSAAWSQNNLLVEAPNVQKRIVGAFHGVDVSSSMDLVIKQGDEDGVAISASDVKTRDMIITEVRDGILHIYVNERGFHWFWGDHHMKAFVSIRNIDHLGASGSSDIYVDGSLHTQSLRIDLSGSSDFKGAVQANHLEMHQTGSSDSNIQGTATDLQVHLTGSSDCKGYGMVVDNCSVEATGSSDTQITVNKELSVHASGSSDVYYKGTAVVREFHTTGSSSISKKG